MVPITDAPVKLSVVVPLKDQTVHENESVTLTWKLSLPGQEVKWYRKDKVMALKSGNKYHMLENGSEYSLTISNAVKADACEYLVKCGNIDSAAKVLVKGKHMFVLTSRCSQYYDNRKYTMTFCKIFIH